MIKIVAISLLVIVASGTDAPAETLNLLTWEKYISPNVVDAWVRETGVSLDQIYYDNADDRDRIIAGGSGQIDLAVIGENTTRSLRSAGLLLPVDEAKVPTVNNSDERWRTRCSDNGLPYMWGTMGIAYRADRVDSPPQSWSDLLEPRANVQKHIAMLKGLEDILTPALLLTGRSINTQDETDLKVAFEILKAQGPSVLTYDYVITSAQDPKIGQDVYMALAYSGDQKTLRSLRGEDWRYVVPKEGSVLWVDCMAVLAASNKRELAYRFLAFLNRPEISAMNAIDLGMPTSNAAAMEKLPTEFTSDEEIFPSEAVMRESSFYEENSPKISQVRKRVVNALLRLKTTP